MTNTVDFVVIGSSGGGGTISWLLAKAGFSVVVLEQGADLAEPLDNSPLQYNPITHDEYKFRLQRPDAKRRLKGDYNTFRKPNEAEAKPFKEGWTGSVLGGGSVIWGTWSFRALPIDFRLETHFKTNNNLQTLKDWGYSVPDWPISYSEMEPFYNVAETLLAVSGDRQAVNESVQQSEWFQHFSAQDHFRNAGNWTSTFPFPCDAYPITPVGDFIAEGMRHAKTTTGDLVNLHPFPLPSGMVKPGSSGYQTRAAMEKALHEWDDGTPVSFPQRLERALKQLNQNSDLPLWERFERVLRYWNDGAKPDFWSHVAEDIWSDQVRDACNMCGFCGEYLCWGKEGPKSGTRVSTLKELRDLPNAEIRTDAKAFEVMYDERTSRATGVRYLDLSDPDAPNVTVQKAKHIIVSCGAVQTARLLRMSGPPEGLGNAHDQLGRNVSFHLFGWGATCTLNPEFQGFLHGEFGHTGNTSSFAHYFVEDRDESSGTKGMWYKAGNLTSTAKKNPLENATGLVNKNKIGLDLLTEMESYPRTVELRLTGDDLPMKENRVDLDPKYVDEYGLPVARITRFWGKHEEKAFQLMKPKVLDIFRTYQERGIIIGEPKYSGARETLIGDHQMGTCRMGEDPTQSVLDRHCRLHNVPNVFVVDSSFMPTGFGLNPMVTVVANALRVGTWIIEQAKQGNEL
jgi:choline dehydrogenase-like flavoprotein